MILYRSPWKFVPIMSIVVLLGGCLDDDDTTPTTLSGTAATGAPIVGGTVNVKCAAGSTPSPATTTNTGAWEVTLTGQTLPCAVEVSGGTVGESGPANSDRYHSLASALGTVNITPLTSLIVANLLGEDPATWFGAPNASGFARFDTTAEIDAAVTTVTTALGLHNALATRNPIRTAFTASNGDPIDDVLEAFNTALTNAGTNFATLLADVRNSTFTAPTGFGAAFANAFAALPSGGGGGSGTASLTASNTSPTTGNGTLQITSVTVEDAGGTQAGTTNRVMAVGTVNGIFAQVQLYYTIANGNIWNVSYRWGGSANQPENVAYKGCDVSCAGASISGGTVTLSNLALPDGTPTLATINGTITSASITTGAGGNTGTLPAGISSKVFDLTYQNAQTGSPFNNGEVLKFTFSESGKLFLGDSYRDIGSFTLSGQEYIWNDSANNRYFAVSLKQDGSLNEINVAGSSNGTPWYGQFAEAASPGGGDSGGEGSGTPSNLGSLTASNTGATQFGASFSPTTFDWVADIGLGWQYKWSISAAHFIQLNGSNVTIMNGNPTWQKPLPPSSQLTFNAVNGTITFSDLTTTTTVGGAQGPLVLNGTLNLTPLNSGPITLAGTGVNFTGSGFNAPVATTVSTATAQVWTWQDARGTTMKLTHILTTGNYQVNFTGMGATPYLSSMNSLNALGIAIDNSAKTITFTNTALANNNTSTSVTMNGVLSMP